jgi:hypothetical protein
VKDTLKLVTKVQLVRELASANTELREYRQIHNRLVEERDALQQKVRELQTTADTRSHELTAQIQKTEAALYGMQLMRMVIRDLQIKQRTFAELSTSQTLVKSLVNEGVWLAGGATPTTNTIPEKK